MPTYKKVLLAAHTMLILAMVVRHPHEAHRPPDLNPERTPVVAQVTL